MLYLVRSTLHCIPTCYFIQDYLLVYYILDSQKGDGTFSSVVHFCAVFPPSYHESLSTPPSLPLQYIYTDVHPFNQNRSIPSLPLAPRTREYTPHSFVFTRLKVQAPASKQQPHLITSLGLYETIALDLFFTSSNTAAPPLLFGRTPCPYTLPCPLQTTPRQAFFYDLFAYLVLGY